MLLLITIANHIYIASNFWNLLYFHQKVPQRWLICLKTPKIAPAHWLNAVPRKLFEAVMSIKEQANLQPILNKEEDGVRLTNFLTNCLQN